MQPTSSKTETGILKQKKQLFEIGFKRFKSFPPIFYLLFYVVLFIILKDKN